MEQIGIDQESHLHTLGGPLHESPITHCEGCRWPIPEGEFCTLDGAILCRSCGVISAAEVLVEFRPGEKLNAVEEQAVGILRRFLFELQRGQVMPSFIFTFGFDHEDPVTGERLAHHYVEIRAPTEQAARNAMFTRFGNRWSMEYLSKEAAGVDRFNLKCHQVIEVTR